MSTWMWSSASARLRTRAPYPAYAAFALAALLLPAEAGQLEADRARLTELTKGESLPAGQIELVVTGDVLAEVVSAIGSAPISVLARSIRIAGQIRPGSSTFLEFHSDPSIEGAVTLEGLGGAWEPERRAFIVHGSAWAEVAVRLKMMIAKVGTRFTTTLTVRESPIFAIVPEDVDGAWFKGQLWLREPQSTDVEIKSKLGSVSVDVPLPTGGPLQAIEIADPVVLGVSVPGGGSVTVTFTPATSTVTKGGVVITGDVHIEGSR